MGNFGVPGGRMGNIGVPGGRMGNFGVPGGRMGNFGVPGGCICNAVANSNQKIPGLLPACCTLICGAALELCKEHSEGTALERVGLTASL